MSLVIDVWLHIFSTLSDKELKIIRATSKEMFQICNKRGFTLKSDASAQAEMFINFATRFKKIDLVVCPIETLDRLINKHTPDHVYVHTLIATKKRERNGLFSVPRIENSQRFTMQVSKTEIGLTYIVKSFSGLKCLWIHNYNTPGLITGEEENECYDTSFSELIITYNEKIPKVLERIKSLRILEFDICIVKNMEPLNALFRCENRIEMIEIDLTQMINVCGKTPELTIPNDSNIKEIKIKTINSSAKTPEDCQLHLIIEKNLNYLTINGGRERCKITLNSDINSLEMSYYNTIITKDKRINIGLVIVVADKMPNIIHANLGIGILRELDLIVILPYKYLPSQAVTWNLLLDSGKELIKVLFNRIEESVSKLGRNIQDELKTFVSVINNNTLRLCHSNRIKIYKIDPSVEHDFKLLKEHFYKFVKEF